MIWIRQSGVGKNLFIITSLLLATLPTRSQAQSEIAFVSDTQAPMWVEKIALRSNQNEIATGIIMADIVQQKPNALFILGDVVALGYQEKKWKSMDRYLANCRNAGIPVMALLGNHDVMGNAKKGEIKFQQRFPQQVRTGYFEIVDSIAVVLLNSNFGTLSTHAMQVQQTWLGTTLKELDLRPDIRAIVVTCHHPPFTNSTIVRSSKEVQQQFVTPFLLTSKSCLFMTGHAHAFEHFKRDGKDFLTIGGGGGLHQPLKTSPDKLEDLAGDYKPMFHYVRLYRTNNKLRVTSYFLKDDFSGIEKGNTFDISLPDHLH